MKAKTIKMVKDDLDARIIKVMENNDMKNSEKDKALEEINKAYATINEIEKNKLEIELKKKKMRIEQKKSKHDMTLDMIKSNNDIIYNEEKILIEKERLAQEESLKLLELEDGKKKTKREMVIKGLEIALPLAVHAGLVLLNFRLIYADDGMSPSSLKDLMKNVRTK